MATYIASVKYEGKVQILRDLEYNNIRECKRELRANGYQIRIVTTEDKFDEACEKYLAKKEDKSIRNKVKWELDKERAKEYGTSVKTFRAARKALLEKDKDGNYVNTASSLEDWIEFYDEHKDFR